MGVAPRGSSLTSSLRREDIDLLGEQVDLDGIHEFPGVLEFLLPFEQLPQPAKPLVVPAPRLRFGALPSLYFQWAAIPSSAIRCISSVRIWTSIRSPYGPITVVCSD